MGQGQEVNLEQAAKLFGYHRRTVDEWITGGCPARKVGMRWVLNTAEVTAWLREREKRLILGDLASIDEAQARRRKLAAEASMAELELALKAGAAVAISDVEARMASMISSARAKLLPMGSKLGPLVAVESDPNECQALIDGAVHEALAELGDERNVPDDTDGESESVRGVEAGGEVVDAATGQNGERVGRRRKTSVERKRG